MTARTRQMESRSGSWVSLQFTEEMRGHVAFGEAEHAQGAEIGRTTGTDLTVRLTIVVDGVDRFLGDPRHQAAVRGQVRCETLGGRLPVEHGVCNLFVAADGERLRQVHYRVHFRDAVGHPLTLSGVRTVSRNRRRLRDVWQSTTTVLARILRGHVAEVDEPAAEVAASGILRIDAVHVARQLASLRTSGPTRRERLHGISEFVRFLLSEPPP